MLPDRVSNPGPLTYESGALPIALRGPAQKTFSLMSERLGIDRELLCAILKFETLKTIKSDSIDEQAGLGLGFAIIV